MSDQPLFQDADEEEAKFAPQQLPQNEARIDADEGASATNADEVPLPLGAVPLGAAGASTGAGGVGGAAGSVSGAAPAIGALALANEVEKNEEEEKRERE